MKNNIRFLLCVCLFWIFPAYAFAENNILNGQIVLQNSGGEPLAGVQVSAIGAGPATSESMGEFELIFSGRKEGDKVRLSLKKKGFEVVNRKELEQKIPSDKNEIVVIVMCKTGERDRHALRYYDIAEKSIQAGYEAELKRIKDDNEKTVKEKNAELEKLKVQRDTALAQAKDLSEKFAQVNLDEASEMYRQAFALFQYGKVEEARQVLDDAKMDQALAAAKKQEEEAKKAIRQGIENYMLKARLCIIGFQFAEAEKNFQKAVDADTENLENTFAFAMYLQKQNRHLKAVPLYEKALDLAEKQKEEDKIATVLNNLGVLYSDKNDYAAAEKSYLRALEIYEKLALSNPATYLPDVAMTQNNLGAFYCSKNDYAAAEKSYLRALEIYEKLALSNPATYLPDVAMTQNNLGNFYKNKNDYAAAEKSYLRALEIYEKLALSNPDTYLPDMAMTQNNLGVFYSDKNDYAAAEKSYLRALEIYEKLALSNPDTYLPYVATTQNNLGLFYVDKNDYAAAEKSYLRALEIREKLAEKNPNVHELDLCASLINLGFLHKSLLEATAEKSHKEKGLALVQRAVSILAKYPDVYQAQKYMKIAKSLQSELENISVEELQTRKQAAEYGNLSWKYLFDRQFAKAGEAAQKGIALDPTQEWIKTNLASSYLFTGQWDKAEAIYLELKDKTYNEKKFRDIFLEDLNELEKTGITHPDMAKVRELLKEP